MRSYPERVELQSDQYSVVEHKYRGMYERAVFR